MPRPNEPGGSPVPNAHKFNQRKKAEFLLALVETGTITGASARIGVTKATVYEHAKHDQSFADDITRARGEWEQALVTGIAQAGFRGKVIERRGTKVQEPGDWRALAWLLEHAPATRERYAGILKSKVEIGGDPDGVPVEVNQTDKVIHEIGPDTMARLQAVVMVLAKAGKLRLPDPGEIIDGQSEEIP